MILVDSSVWIDYFRGRQSPETDRLDALVGAERVVTGDLILAEVLQGFRADRDFSRARSLMDAYTVLELGGPDIALRAAQNFRSLRARGITPRKTIDTIIATYCIAHGLTLLFSDRDFEPFVEYLGLESALPAHGVSI